MLKQVKIECPAKLNLFLNINGYDQNKQMHTVKMINQSINLYDIVYIQENLLKKDGIIIKINNDILNDDTNNCYKAAKLFFDYTGITTNSLEIKIDKKIPNMAGLGGEDTDVAGILIGLDRYYQTNLTIKELMTLGFQISAGVPYFIKMGCALVTGYGEQVNKYLKNPYTRYLIIKPNISLNSKEMINKLNQNRLANKYILENILSNDFLSVVPEEVKNIRKVLSRYSGLEHSLSGCGPSYFIAFRKNILNLGVNAILKKEFPDYKFYDVVNTDYRKVLVKYE